MRFYIILFMPMQGGGMEIIMFDILGIIAFWVMAVSFVALILSLFKRRMNQKLWIIILVLSAVLLISSYYLDMAFGKENPVKIDYSNVKLDPTPTPTPSPTPSPTPAPTPMVIEKKTKAPAPTARPAETQAPQESAPPEPTAVVPQEPVAPPAVPEQPPKENVPSENTPAENPEAPQ